MKVKKSSLPVVALRWVKEYWLFLTLVGGVITTAVSLPGRLQATEKKVEVVEKRTDKVEKYIQALEEQKEAVEKAVENAPEGWIWSLVDEKYIPDPNYEAPKKRRGK